MTTNWTTKDPDEVADYWLEWTLDESDAIASSVWVFRVAAGVTKDSDQFSANETRIWLRGGTSGETAVLENTITTTGGRTFEEVVFLPIVSNYPEQVLSPGYIIPSPATLKAMYPAFAAVPDATVALYIAQAGRSVDTSWTSTDFADAIMLLACHNMVTAGLGAGAEAEMNAQGMGGFTLMRSGQLTLQRSATSRADADGVPSPWKSTAYGIAFYWLLRRNKPPVGVAAGEAFGDPTWYGHIVP